MSLRFSHILALLLLLAPALGLTADLSTDLCSPPSDELVAVQVDRVFDGDSLKLNDGRQVRIIGINTPEQGEFLADKARQVLRQSIGGSKNRQKVYMQLGQDRRDSHGRILAHLWLADPDGSWVSPAMQLLAQGLAFHIAISPNLTYLSCYAEAETLAKAANKGLWARLRPIQASSRGIKRGFAFIQGSINNIIDKGRAGSELVLAGDNLGLWVPAKSYRLFGGKQGLEALVGEELLVRGWVYKYKNNRRLQLEVSHPAMISVVK